MKSEATGYPPVGWTFVCDELESVDISQHPALADAVQLRAATTPSKKLPFLRECLCAACRRPVVLSSARSAGAETLTHVTQLINDDHPVFRPLS